MKLLLLLTIQKRTIASIALLSILKFMDKVPQKSIRQDFTLKTLVVANLNNFLILWIDPKTN